MSRTGTGEELTPADRPAGRGRGGSRAGVGRKPGSRAGTLPADVAYARDLLAGVMRDETRSIELRIRSALAVLASGTWPRRRATGPAGACAGPGGDPISS
jgi:hypothetical protein